MNEDATDPIVMEALEWFVRMRDDKVTGADRQAFEAWLTANEAHAAAWKHAQTLWARFDIMQPEFDRMRRGRPLLSRRNFILGSVAVIGGLGGLYAINQPGLFAEYKTDIGERMTIGLPDDSTVELGSYSALSAHFSETERRVELYRGEGFFDVSRDPARPFLVDAGGGSTRTLGTKFDVKFVDDLVTVAVSEHAVQVQGGSFSNLRLEEGWQVSYGRNGLGQPTEASLDTVQAWRSDRIIFQDVPLRRVLAELERYRRGRIILMDSSIGDIPVTAIFETARTESALETIADTLGIRLLSAANYVTLVYRAG
ncbi:FecR family protein [Rhizobium sp. P40RR-XXII]|uniref:FecR family protein n=1 Tax=Rhizobium sp. P40RR-XXII TaxID=2726739 RepID=UPI0014575409|nr:FecR family protein [Rhizobium sp. P40RR-XXII]NLS18615.1 FecR family protein [Rhizobium sp. P40RR-XXII]